MDAFIEKFQAQFTPVVKSAGGGPQTRMVQAGGMAVRTLSVGEGGGTPVLLIHGFGGDLLSWLFTQESLAQGRVAHAFDLPGHGGSTKAIAAGGVADLAAATLAVMEALGLDKAHLVGHSLGGAIAAHLALTQPHRVASASLIAPAGLGPEINIGFIEGFITENRARKLRTVLQTARCRSQPDQRRHGRGCPQVQAPRGAEAALRLIANVNFGGGVQKTVLRDGLTGARMPIAVIFGEDDRVIPPRHAEGLSESIWVTRVAGAGHIPHMEKSSVVNEAITANIAKGD